MSWGGAWSSLLTFLRLPWNAGPGDPQITLDGRVGEITVQGADPDDRIIITPNGAGSAPAINIQSASNPGDTVAGITYGTSGPQLTGGEYVDFVDGELVRQKIRLEHFFMQLGAVDTASNDNEGGGLVLADDRARLGWYDSAVAQRSLMVDSTGWKVDSQLTTSYLGRGMWERVASAVNAAATPVGTETIVLTLGNRTYRANRAYEVRHIGGANGAAANSRVWYRLKKTNLAGITVCLYLRWQLAVAGQVYETAANGRVFTVGAADVVAVLVWCLNAEVGNVTHSVVAGTPRAIEIWDIGDAADYPDAPVLS